MSKHDENLIYRGSYKEACTLVTTGGLPAGFSQWTIANKHGWTVAHVAASFGMLPHNFDRWDIVNKYAWSVAHEAVEHSSLPESFSQWGLPTEEGWTVAHEAAVWGRLPDNFSQWGRMDSQETTVLRTVRKCKDGLLSISYLRRIMERWDKEKPLCRTDADWEVFKKELPEIYYKYAVKKSIPDVCDEVAHGALL
jgi:hypothetical protein